MFDYCFIPELACGLQVQSSSLASSRYRYHSNACSLCPRRRAGFPHRARSGSPATAESEAPVAIAEIRRSDAPRRSSDGASIGDTLLLSIDAGRPSELRVYGDTGEPLARCPGAPGCTVEPSPNGHRLELELVLRASGTVRAVLFTGASIPRSFESLNADAETAQRANVDARQVAFLHVQ